MNFKPVLNRLREPSTYAGLAVLAESLYLANLLVAPGLAFGVLVWLWLKHRHSAPPLARSHLRQACHVSVVAGLLIVVLSGVILALGGWQWHWTWVVVLTYFVCIHGTLVMLGMYALSKAMAGQPWRSRITSRWPLARSMRISRQRGRASNISANLRQSVSGNQSAAAISMPTIFVQALLATQVP